MQLPTFRATFVDRQTGEQWIEILTCLPGLGHRVRTAKAPPVRLFVVAQVEHAVGFNPHVFQEFRVELDRVA